MNAEKDERSELWMFFFLFFFRCIDERMAAYYCITLLKKTVKIIDFQCSCAAHLKTFIAISTSLRLLHYVQRLFLHLHLHSLPGHLAKHWTSSFNSRPKSFSSPAIAPGVGRHAKRLECGLRRHNSITPGNDIATQLIHTKLNLIQ